MLDQGTMAGDGGEQRRSTDVPDAYRTVHGSGGQEAIVGAERAVHFVITVIRTDVTQFQVRGLLAEHVKQGSRLSVPDSCAAIERDRCNPAAVVTERDTLQLGVALVAGQPGDLGSVRYVPKGGEIAV